MNASESGFGESFNYVYCITVCVKLPQSRTFSSSVTSVGIYWYQNAYILRRHSSLREHLMPPPPTTIYLQEACLRHQFIRSKDTSNVVERPERLRAMNIGIAAVISRCEETAIQPTSQDNLKDKLGPSASNEDSELTSALERLTIGNKILYPSPQLPLHVVKSNATLDVLNHPAVKFVHGDIEGDVYLENLIKWAKQSREKIAADGTEIPTGLAQGDLYRTCFARSHSISQIY